MHKIYISIVFVNRHFPPQNFGSLLLHCKYYFSSCSNPASFHKCSVEVNWSTWSFYIKFLDNTSPFCGTTVIPVMEFWWRLPWISKSGWNPLLACFLVCVQWIPQIHLWWDTCWLHSGQHGSQVFFDQHTYERSPWKLLVLFMANEQHRSISTMEII